MKKIFVLVALIALSVPSIVLADLNSVCPLRRDHQHGSEIYKVKQSDHIPSSDPRKKSTAWIIQQGKSGYKVSKTCLQVYDNLGNLIHKMGRYSINGTYPSRHYGGHACGDGKSPTKIAKKAKQNTGIYRGWIDTGSYCVKIKDLRKRQD